MQLSFIFIYIYICFGIGIGIFLSICIRIARIVCQPQTSFENVSERTPSIFIALCSLYVRALRSFIFSEHSREMRAHATKLMEFFLYFV